MARTSASFGTMILVTVLGLLTLGLFVTTLMFFGELNKTERELTDLRSSTDRFVQADEQQRDDILRIADLANQERASVVGYLNDALRSTMTRVTGRPADTFESMQEQFAALGVAEGQNAMGLIRGMQNEIAGLEQRVADAESSKAAAESNLLAERERVQTIDAAFTAELDTVKDQLAANQGLVDNYRTGIDDLERQMDARLESSRSDARNNEALLNDQIARLERDLLTYRDTIARLQQESAADRPSPTDEYALVDGEVVGIAAGDNEVFLSLGRTDKIRIGMTFSVYSEATAIRPDSSGNYAQGKGFIEVVRVEENSSAARVLRELPGNPIVPGDVLANPVYDPNKEYSFIVYGNFDVDGDGLATAIERTELAAQIREWGGEVLSSDDGITGNVDFLVLGAKPNLPPAPPGTAPIDVLREYARKTRIVRQYDDLLASASAINLPVLNQNRLQTLLFGR